MFILKIIFIFQLILLDASYAKTFFNFTVLHTNDLHSYLEGTGPDLYFTEKIGDRDIVKGHYARLGHLIVKEREENQKVESTLLLDAGDFFGGTMFHSLGPSISNLSYPEAEFFKALKYDATTLGNHEFDAFDKGLEIMLDKWRANKVPTKIVSSNYFFKKKNGSLEKKLSGVVEDYIVKEISFSDQKLRVGIFGLLGPDGALSSLGTRKEMSFVGFNDDDSQKELDNLIIFMKEKVTRVKKKHNLDIVITILHGGHPEDKEILESIPEINLLIAGHTHQVYPSPIRIGKALLVQAGCFGQYLGKLKLSWDGDRLSLRNKDTVLEVNDSVPANKEVSKLIEQYKKELNQTLKMTGLAYNTPIFKSDRKYIKENLSQSSLGRFITTGVMKSYNENSKEPIGLYFTATGLIRKGIDANLSYQLSDIFKILGIGFDEFLKAGPRVVSFYLSKKEVFNLINFLETYGSFHKKFTPAFSSNVSYTTRSWGLPFLNRLKNLQLDGLEYSKWPKLIHIGSSEYVASYLPKVAGMSYGLLEFIPKDKFGRPLTSPYVHREKEYILLAKYLKGLR